MNTLILFLALTTWFGLGYPIARHLGAVQWTALAAPPIGLAIHGVLTPLIYLHGFTASLTCAICLGLAAPGVFWDSGISAAVLGRTTTRLSALRRSPRFC